MSTSDPTDTENPPAAATEPAERQRRVLLLGRELELQRLLTVLEAAATQRQARTVLVRGDEGLGRTRLCEALLEQLAIDGEREGAVAWRTLLARAQPTRRGAARVVIGDLLRVAAGVPEGTPLTSARTALLRLVSEHDEDRAGPEAQAHFEDLASLLGDLLGIEFRQTRRLEAARTDPRVIRDLLRVALGDLFSRWCRERPTLVVIDDIESCDASSMAMLAFLRRRLDLRRMVLLCTSGSSFDGRGLGVTDVFDLGPLANGRTADLVSRVRGRPEASIVHRAGGVPGFAVELARYVREGGDPDTLPETLEVVLRRRLLSLPTEALQVVRRAAVVGEHFWDASLVALGEPRTPLRALRELTERELIVACEVSRFRGLQEWRFAHTAVHVAALEMSTDSQRRQLHALAARWLADKARTASGEIARHFSQAGDDPVAIGLWLRAAVDADRCGDARAVLDFSGRALAAVADQPTAALSHGEEWTLRVRRAEAFHAIGRTRALDLELATLARLAPPDDNRASGAFERAVARSSGSFKRPSTGVLEQPAPPPVSSSHARPLVEDVGAMRVRLELVRARRHGERGEFDEAIDSVLGGLEVADRIGVPILQARTRALLTGLLGQAAQPSLAGLYVDALMELGRQYGGVVDALAHSTRAILAALCGQLGEATLCDFLIAKEGFAQGGFVRESLEAALNAGAALLALGEYQAARAALDDARELAGSLDMERQLGWVSCNLGLSLVYLGELELAERDLERARHIGESLDDRRLAAASLCNLSALAIHRDEPDVALGCAEAAVTHGGKVGGPIEAIARAAHAIALVAQSRHAEAMRGADAAFSLAARVGGLEQFDVELALAASQAREACGLDRGEVSRPIEEALGRVAARLAEIGTPRLRTAFVHQVEAHRQLARRARALDIALPPSLGAVLSTDAS